MKKLDIKLMHPVEQINMVIGRIYRKRNDYNLWG